MLPNIFGLRTIWIQRLCLPLTASTESISVSFYRPYKLTQFFQLYCPNLNTETSGEAPNSCFSEKAVVTTLRGDTFRSLLG